MTTRSIAGRDRHLRATGGRYLLFAGTQPPPSGGLGDPLDTFTTEEAARQAFRDVRLRMSSPTSWAQLAVVDDRHGVKPMCWFGTGAAPERNNSAPGAPSTKPRAHRPAPPRNPSVIETAASQAMTAAPPRPPRRLIVPLVVAALALLSGVPVIAIGSSGSSTVWATLAVLACALISVLLTRVRRDAGPRRTRHAQKVHDRRLEER